MGFRYQRRINLTKGWGFNLSKSGISSSYRTSSGTFGSKGFSLRTGIPGLSYTGRFKKRDNGVFTLLFIFCVFIFLTFVSFVTWVFQILLFIVLPAAVQVICWVALLIWDFLRYLSNMRTRNLQDNEEAFLTDPSLLSKQSGFTTQSVSFNKNAFLSFISIITEIIDKGTHIIRTQQTLNATLFNYGYFPHLKPLEKVMYCDVAKLVKLIPDEEIRLKLMSTFLFGMHQEVPGEQLHSHFTSTNANDNIAIPVELLQHNEIINTTFLNCTIIFDTFPELPELFSRAIIQLSNSLPTERFTTWSRMVRYIAADLKTTESENQIRDRVAQIF